MALDTIATTAIGVDRAVEPPFKPEFTAIGDPTASGSQRAIPTANAPDVRSASLDPHRISVREVTARSGPSGETVGHRILDRLEAVHKADLAYRARRPAASADSQPTLKVATRLPGPAEARLTPTGIGAPEAGGPDEARNRSVKKLEDVFEAVQARMDEAASYHIQSNVLTKVTGSFGTNLNKLISSQ